MLNLYFTGDMNKFCYDQFDYSMTMFNAYKKHGILPFEGPFVDQPNKIIEIFSVLEQIEFEAEKKARKKHEQEMKQANRKAKRGRY